MARIKILHIEDEEMYQKLVCAMLDEEGYDVFSAGTGEEGLRMLEEIKPDLLILDINLPDADGYDICRRLRQEERWAKLPILMATVRRHPEEWRKGFSAGASDYVAKPLYGPELSERVKSCLEGKTAQGDGATNPEVLMVRATLIGNRGAFDVFVRQYKDDLFKTMESEVGRNADEADDLVAMAFTRAYEHLDQFRGDSPFYTWIYCIAKNELKRKSRQIRTTPLEEPSPEDAEDPDASAQMVCDRPSQSDVNEQFRLELQSAIARVPRRHRKPLDLLLMHGFSYDMIAKEMELPAGTIMSRLSRGKNHLRRVWQAIVHSET